MIKSNFKLKNKTKINEYLNSLYYEKHSSIEKGFSTFGTDISKEDNFPLKLFKPLFDKIISLLNYEFDIIDFWVNIYEKEGCVIKHNHKPKPKLKSFKSFSGVFYFKKPINSGNLFVNDKIQFSNNYSDNLKLLDLDNDSIIFYNKESICKT